MCGFVAVVHTGRTLSPEVLVLMHDAIVHFWPRRGRCSARTRTLRRLRDAAAEDQGPVRGSAADEQRRRRHRPRLQRRVYNHQIEGEDLRESPDFAVPQEYAAHYETCTQGTSFLA